MFTFNVFRIRLYSKKRKHKKTCENNSQKYDNSQCYRNLTQSASILILLKFDKIAICGALFRGIRGLGYSNYSHPNLGNMGILFGFLEGLVLI